MRKTVEAPRGDMSIEAARYRSVLGHVPTGVVVVAAIHGGLPVGMAIGSFTSVSLDPPLVGFFADKRSSTLQRLRSAGAFCVNVLAHEQEDVCRRFATTGDDKFAGVKWHVAASGSPVLHGVTAYVDCALERADDAGDHVLVLGRVIDLDVLSSAGPLVFHRGSYSRLSPCE